MSEAKQEGGALGRWSRRKAQAMQAEDSDVELEEATVGTDLLNVEEQVVEPPAPLTDKDMPPLDTLNEDSDYSGFLSPNVSEALRKQALRKLFSSTIFNCVDGLDDYDEDFTSFEPLGDLVTADMKHQMEMEAKRKAEAPPEDEGSDGDDSAEDVVDDSSEDAADENADDVAEPKEDSETVMLPIETIHNSTEQSESTNPLEDECDLEPKLKDDESRTRLEERQ